MSQTITLAAIAAARPWVGAQAHIWVNHLTHNAPLEGTPFADLATPDTSIWVTRIISHLQVTYKDLETELTQQQARDAVIQVLTTPVCLYFGINHPVP